MKKLDLNCDLNRLKQALFRASNEKQVMAFSRAINNVNKLLNK